MSFVRASGCKYPKCLHCGHDKILDPPSTEVVEGWWSCSGRGVEGIEINISARLTPRSIILCLLTLGVVTVLTLLAARCIELNLSG